MSKPLEATKNLIAGMELRFMSGEALPDRGKMAAYVTELSTSDIIELYADLKYAVSVVEDVRQRVEAQTT